MKHIEWLPTRIAAALLVLTFSVVRPCLADRRGPSSCGADSAVLLAALTETDPTAHRAASREFYRLKRSCATGPTAAAERAAFFRFASEYPSLDFVRLCAIWLRDVPEKDRSGEDCEPRVLREDISAYVDRIVDPARDLDYAEAILRAGGDEAIAKLGPAAIDRVIVAATTPGDEENEGRCRAAAIGALGRWVDPRDVRFSAADKARVTAILLGLLPEPTKAETDGPDGRALKATLTALAHADDELVRQTLQSWAIEFSRDHGDRSDLIELAKRGGQPRPRGEKQ